MWGDGVRDGTDGAEGPSKGQVSTRRLAQSFPRFVVVENFLFWKNNIWKYLYLSEKGFLEGLARLPLISGGVEDCCSFPGSSGWLVAPGLPSHSLQRLAQPNRVHGTLHGALLSPCLGPEDCGGFLGSGWTTVITAGETTHPRFRATQRKGGGRGGGARTRRNNVAPAPLLWNSGEMGQLVPGVVVPRDDGRFYEGKGHGEGW